ncbi:hypothetical protein [Novipirellula artificiosorum]|uniref:Uncharacterized protein n=1 Tax=Novipirellula artificiosorum TaxID=2528016 RepID=A0A5C6CZS8_9BACT|nr:hypothetical protein [Novipirellula artificiosorum]TWU28991.1 hypothetical protein Poly41_67820 [Novipirellula artificiosorum]
MIKPTFVFLAPLGCLLMLIFRSLTPFRMMSMIGEMMQPDSRFSDVTSMAPVGAFGAVMFGLGMMSLTLLMRKPSHIARILLVYAALLMIAGAASNLFGDWLMMSAFRDLAMADHIDADAFLDSFRWAKTSMLVGYALLLAATAAIAAGATRMETKARMARTSIVIGSISLLLLLLMVLWSQISILPFSEVLGGDSVNPSSLAGSMNGVLRSDFLSQGSMFGFAVATLIVAVSRRKGQTKDGG